MKTEKHTPGPWGLSKTSDGQLRKIRSADDALICNMVERECDARLIAAAPELLDTLESLVQSIYDSSQWVDQPSVVTSWVSAAEALLSKVRGA